MTATIPVPIWIVFLFILCAVAWQVATTYQTKYLRELFDLYMKFSYGTGNEELDAAIDDARGVSTRSGLADPNGETK